MIHSFNLLTKATARISWPILPFQIVSGQDNLVFHQPSEGLNLVGQSTFPNVFEIPSTRSMKNMFIHRFGEKLSIPIPSPPNFVWTVFEVE